MPMDPNPKVTIPGSGVLLHVLNTSGEPVPVQGDDNGAITTAGGGGGGGGTVDQGTAGADPWLVDESNSAAIKTAVESIDTKTPALSSGRVPVDGSGVTQPVSGTVTANAGTGTFAISAASLPLPTGAATAAKQPALGTAGSASADVITIQGISGGVELSVNTELPPAAALSDTTANPTAPMVGSGNMLWNGSTWNRWVGTTNGGYVQGPVGAGNAVAGNPLLFGLRDDGGLVRSILGDSLGRIRVVGPGPTTAATSVSTTPATISFTTAGSPVAAQNATTKASAGRLHGFRVRGAAAGTYYLQWHDVASTGGLASGTQRGLGFEVSGAGDDVAYSFPQPISFTTGITWALSTAIDSYTAAAGKTVYVDPVWE